MDANIPGELTGPLPRKVRVTGSGVYLTLLASACLTFAFAAGVWAAKNTARQIEQRAALRRDSSMTVGEITRLRQGKGTETVYYSFGVNGMSYTGEAELPWQLRNDLERSNSISTRYLPAHPDVNHPAGWEWSFFWWIPLSTDLVHLPDFSKEFQWFFAPFIFGPFGGVVLMSLRKERKLLVNGAPAAGLVTSCTPGTRGSFSVKYEFRTEDGRVIQGKSGGPRKKIGDSLCVLYLQQNPRQSQPYPSGNYRVAE
jgi:hypothetical protein